MKQIIKEVFQAEEKVGEILKQARNKASEIRHAVEKENAEKMADAKQKAREIIQTAVEEAKNQAERTRQEKLDKARQEKDTLLKDKKETIDNLVDQICNIVIKPALDCAKLKLNGTSNGHRSNGIYVSIPGSCPTAI